MPRLVSEFRYSFEPFLGDSGGPLVQADFIDGNPIEWQIGIVSFGLGCGRVGLGASYSSVNYYASWIANTINHYIISNHTIN